MMNKLDPEKTEILEASLNMFSLITEKEDNQKSTK